MGNSAYTNWRPRFASWDGYKREKCWKTLCCLNVRRPQHLSRQTPLILIAAGPLPTLDGLADVVGKRNVSPLPRFPPVNHDDIRRFKRNFDSAGPIDGLLDSMWF